MSLLFAYSALPPLSFGQIPPISLARFYDILDLNLGKRDTSKLISLRGLIDVKNIMSFQAGVLFDSKGNFLEAGLRLALSSGEYLPEYILTFLEENSEEKDFFKNFPKLYATFFSEEINKGGVPAEFLTFERDLNLVLLGFAGKKQGVNVESYLKYEDLSDPLVTAVILQSKSTGGFIFPYEYSVLGEKILSSGADPMKQYIAITSFKFNFYNDIINCDSGSFRSICAYMMCLWILEEKAALDEKKGRKILTELVESEYE